MANKTMHHVIIGDDTYEIVDQYAREHGAEIDATLTQSGKAADAKAVGDALKNVSGVPSSVRTAMLTLFQKAAYIEEGLADEVAVVQAWASEVTAITISASAISINGATTNQLSAVTTPAGGVVTWESSNTAVATVSNTGLVTGVGNGTAVITARSGDVSATCTATVTGFATLTGIDATYTQSGTVYDTASLDDLKTDLVVTASYDNGTTATITNYTMSGTLAEGTSTITVSYDGFTDTFSVTVSSYSTSPSIAQYDVSWTTSGATTEKVGGCITDYYEITIDPTALKATSHYDATNDYMTTAGDIWKLKLLRPNSQSISFGSGGKMIAEVTRDGVRKFNYFSPAWSSDTEANVGDSRQMTNVLNADNSKIKISFTLATADIDDSYAYWDTTTSGVMPIGITAGDIIFAGRNTPYYGLHNINEASS